MRLLTGTSQGTRGEPTEQGRKEMEEELEQGEEDGAVTAVVKHTIRFHVGEIFFSAINMAIKLHSAGATLRARSCLVPEEQ